MSQGSHGSSNASPPLAAPADDAAHLLIVDDDRRIRALLSRLLSEAGYRVTTAADAAEAMARLCASVLSSKPNSRPGSHATTVQAVQYTGPRPLRRT